MQKDVPALDKTIPKMEDAWRRLDRAAHASEGTRASMTLPHGNPCVVGAVQDLENAIDDVMASVDLADAGRLVPAAKDTMAKRAWSNTASQSLIPC